VISEIKGKISQSGSNLTSRSEDKLTGDFFGAIRYLPVEDGLKGILSQVQFANAIDTEDWHAMLSSQIGYVANYTFWPKNQKGEIDLLIEFEDVLIGIEVKYISGISSEDELTENEPINYEKSVHQLSRYSQMLEEKAGNRKAYLVFLAPYDIQRHVQQEHGVKYRVSPYVTIGYVSWEDLHTSLILMMQKAKPGAQQLILTDAEQLLRVKRLVRFSGFTKKGFLQNIPHSPYVYKREDVLTVSTWTWSENHLEEEQPYVYNTK
jgi:hypothetical protein